MLNSQKNKCWLGYSYGILIFFDLVYEFMENLSRLSRASLWNSRPLTFLPHKERIEAQVVNTEVHPTLPGDLPLPVAARVIVDKLLFFRHPKQPVEFHDGFFKLFCVVVFLDVIDFVILCNDALIRNKTQSTRLVSIWQAEHTGKKERISKIRIFKK